VLGHVKALDQAPDDHRCEDDEDDAEHTRNSYGVRGRGNCRQCGVETWHKVDSDVDEDHYQYQPFNKIYL